MVFSFGAYSKSNYIRINYKYLKSAEQSYTDFDLILRVAFYLLPNVINKNSTISKALLEIIFEFNLGH